MKTVFTAAAALLMLGPALGAQSQSLADLSRQEEARRKAITAPAKVYTNDSLRDAGSPPAVMSAAPSTQVAAPAPPVEAQAPAAAGVRPAATATDEAAWRKRIATAREGLARSKTLLDALQSRINALTADFSARCDPAQRAVLGNERDKALAELERITKEIQQAQKAIADTQEEGRRVGVPAAWVR